MRGEFIDIGGERFYAIRNVDRMKPFFISVISNVDHWLFVSSNGGLTAGRVSPDTALFPYITVDKIHDSPPHTGSKTILRVDHAGQQYDWEPFNREHDGIYPVTRNLYKNLLSNKLCFEEINEDLELTFRYTWATSDTFGFCRRCELINQGDRNVTVDLVDGLQNILPAGTPRFAQTNTSNLVDAYKWTELDEKTGLAYFTLYSRITDRAEPAESLKANTAFCLGLDGAQILLSSRQLDAFRRGGEVAQETHTRGMRGAYFVNTTVELSPGENRRWQIVADIEQSQAEVVALRRRLADEASVAEDMQRSISRGSDGLARIMAGADAFQLTAEETVSVHHYANVLFNVLRGGNFDNQYKVSRRDLAETVRFFNRTVYTRSKDFLGQLPDTIDVAALLQAVEQHGDPSRPWNLFEIKLEDEQGNPLLSYQGNWRDIFQNWEALTLSYPGFVESIIAKFVNASTVDGYNPYRITKEGIDWEVEEPDDPWSYIGYWGDHQIIYLQKLLELSGQFHPERLGELLHKPIFCYANVPYRIKPFTALLRDPKNTVTFDDDLAARIEQRVAETGADGKLLLAADGEVYRVNLFEKLLVPLLAKLGNLVIDGGIWMNTQRPEWNDANNALVGNGLSMVTLYYMRRYVRFLSDLLASRNGDFDLSGEVGAWFDETAAALASARPLLKGSPIESGQRFAILSELGEAASRYRETLYRQEGFSGKVAKPVAAILALLDDALRAIDHSIGVNRRDDGLYHAYNLLDLKDGAVEVEPLYEMLEGQVAALSAGAVEPAGAVAVLEALFESAIYRRDQKSFMLYPDRKLPAFLEKNRIAPEDIAAIPLLGRMLEKGDTRVIVRDEDGTHRFNADFTNAGDLAGELDAMSGEYGDELDAAREPLLNLFEDVFDHKAFTGRSGTMFGFEGLGCIYWHMVSKLLLAAQENFFAAVEKNADPDIVHRLGELYYRIREGIGFNKTPAEYGAFPTDPYSHTPKDSGARQPGMTGQVKEEILTRFGELGVRIAGGAVRFEPSLLRAREFTAAPRNFCYLGVDGEWHDLALPERSLAFTWCQVPVVFELAGDSKALVDIEWADGSSESCDTLALSAKASADIIGRAGGVRRIHVKIPPELLFAE